MRSRTPSVRIHYRRPPDDEQVFVQTLLLDTDGVKVTLALNVVLDSPVRVDGDVVLEPGSDVVWFTFPGRWHDIGRFHRVDGTFTGLYANILTPPTFDDGGSVWRTTDLFLDLWLEPDGALAVLDRDQLAGAVRKGWIEPEQADRARAEVRRLREAHAASRWPPPVVEGWTLERALREVADGRGGDGRGGPATAHVSDGEPR